MKKLFISITALIVCVMLAYFIFPSFKHAVYFQYYTKIKHPEIAGGPCGPNCNGYNEYASEAQLSNTDTLPLFAHQEKDRILLTGTIHNFYGTPAKDVILYVFHTDSNGVYLKRDGATGAEALNGYIRGWIKTEADGRYFIYTNLPGSYPDEKTRAHVHCIIKEPNVNVYSLMDFIFPNDPYQSESEVGVPHTKNGGLVKNISQPGDAITVYKRDIYLGRGVVNYPKKKKGE